MFVEQLSLLDDVAATGHHLRYLLRLGDGFWQNQCDCKRKFLMTIGRAFFSQKEFVPQNKYSQYQQKNKEHIITYSRALEGTTLNFQLCENTTEYVQILKGPLSPLIKVIF